MNDASDAIPAIAQALRRLEALTANLEAARDSAARQTARELLELVLDLHGLGLARLSAIIAKAENGQTLMERFVADPYVRALLLLHGLHPRSADERLREAVERIRPEWESRGVAIELVSVDAASAHVRLRVGAGVRADLARSEIEGVLVDEAPDLDDLVVEVGPSVDATKGAEPLSVR